MEPIFFRSSRLPATIRAWCALGKEDRKSTRLNSSHSQISYAVFCLKKKRGIPHLETITILVVLVTIKASLVVAYYMHLRYEPRWIALIPLRRLALVAVLVAALPATSVHP